MANSMNRAMTRTELAKIYNVHYNTFSKWLKLVPNLQLDAKFRVLTPKQVRQIVEHLGDPFA